MYTDLQYILSNCELLFKYIIKLKTYELSIQESFDCIQHVIDTLSDRSGPASKVAIKALNDVLAKNKELKILELIARIFNTQNIKSWPHSDIAIRKIIFAFITSVDVERSFSRYTYLLTLESQDQSKTGFTNSL